MNPPFSSYGLDNRLDCFFIVPSRRMDTLNSKRCMRISFLACFGYSRQLMLLQSFCTSPSRQILEGMSIMWIWTGATHYLKSTHAVPSWIEPLSSPGMYNIAGLSIWSEHNYYYNRILTRIKTKCREREYFFEKKIALFWKIKLTGWKCATRS